MLDINLQGREEIFLINKLKQYELYLNFYFFKSGNKTILATQLGNRCFSSLGFLYEK